MIKRTKDGKYILVSRKTGRPLSKPGTRLEALKRERQVQYFKHHPHA